MDYVSDPSLQYVLATVETLHVPTIQWCLDKNSSTSACGLEYCQSTRDVVAKLFINDNVSDMHDDTICTIL